MAKILPMKYVDILTTGTFLDIVLDTFVISLSPIG